MPLHRTGTPLLVGFGLVANIYGQRVPRGKNRGGMVVRFILFGVSLTLLVLMKGHVGDGARSGGLWAPATGIKSMP